MLYARVSLGPRRQVPQPRHDRVRRQILPQRQNISAPSKDTAWSRTNLLCDEKTRKSVLTVGALALLKHDFYQSRVCRSVGRCVGGRRLGVRRGGSGGWCGDSDGHVVGLMVYG